MENGFLKLFSSLNGASLLLILLTTALTTASFMAAYPGVWTCLLVAGCNAVTADGTQWLVYRNFQTLR